MTDAILDNLLALLLSKELLWAIVGALLSLVLPAMVFRIRQSRSKFHDVWHSRYQGIDEASSSWVSEMVTVTTRFGRLRLKNSDNSGEYDYTAYGKLFKEDYLHGEWTSQYPGGTNRGVFVLTFPHDWSFHGWLLGWA